MKKISLVLEGGGMRGAYTAGCLAWLIDNGIEFDAAYGISTGAVHLCSYLCKNIDYLYDLSTNHIADKELIGIRPLIREHCYVGYDYLFEHILPVIKHYDIDKARRSACDASIGIYDMEKGTFFLKVKDIDKDMLLLKAACTLPVIGKVVNYEGRDYLDGGITKMIPIEEAIRDGADEFLIITTKPKGYVRKEATALVKSIMRTMYKKYPNVEKDYAVRHINYQKQIDIINGLVAENKAVYMYPSKVIPVKRLTGDKPNLRLLYQLGYDDMAQRSEELIRRFKKKDA